MFEGWDRDLGRSPDRGGHSRSLEPVLRCRRVILRCGCSRYSCGTIVMDGASHGQAKGVPDHGRLCKRSKFKPRKSRDMRLRALVCACLMFCVRRVCGCVVCCLIRNTAALRTIDKTRFHARGMHGKARGKKEASASTGAVLGSSPLGFFCGLGLVPAFGTDSCRDWDSDCQRMVSPSSAIDHHPALREKGSSSGLPLGENVEAHSTRRSA